MIGNESCSDESESDVATDEENPRPIATTTQMQKFDTEGFKKRKWLKLQVFEQKEITGIIGHQVLQKLDNTKKCKRDSCCGSGASRSNRTLSLERSSYMTAMRGIYFCHYNMRKPYDSQDEASVACSESWR